jgi:putative FmdB family regulatory protein
MAIYEYYCVSCRKEFELMRPMSQSDAPASCPSCGAKGQKLVSASASKVDYYVRAPSKPPFRQHPPAKS